MKLLVKDEQLSLNYEPGMGAWTFNIKIPGTKRMVIRWGYVKVSGSIDECEIKNKNLADLGEGDKLITINKNERKAIGKTGGDMVNVTLYLHTEESIEESLRSYKKLPD